MKCPKCGSTLRPSKKYPGYYLCDTCRKRYAAPSSINDTSSKKKPTKKKRKRKNSFIRFLFFVALLALTITGLYFSGIIQFEEPEVAQVEKIEQFLSTDTITTDDIKLKINSIETLSGTSLVKPSSGNLFLLIDVEVTNLSEDKISVYSASNFNLLQNNQKIPYSASPYQVLTDDQDRLDVTLSSGDTVSGYLCYEVPADWSTAYLEFVTPVWSLHKIHIELHNTSE